MKTEPATRERNATAESNVLSVCVMLVSNQKILSALIVSVRIILLFLLRSKLLSLPFAVTNVVMVVKNAMVETSVLTANVTLDMFLRRRLAWDANVRIARIYLINL